MRMLLNELLGDPSGHKGEKVTGGVCLLLSPNDEASFACQRGLVTKSALTAFNHVLFVTKERWTKLPVPVSSDNDNRAYLDVCDALGHDRKVEFVYPESYDHLVQFVAALGAKFSSSTVSSLPPDLLLIDRLDDFVGSDQPLARTHAKRKLTKLFSLVSNLVLQWMSGGGPAEPRLSLKDEALGGNRELHVIVSMSGVGSSIELSPDEVNNFNVWCNEVWHLSQQDEVDGISNADTFRKKFACDQTIQFRRCLVYDR